MEAEGQVRECGRVWRAVGVLAECYVRKGQWDQAKMVIERVKGRTGIYTLPYWDHVVNQHIQNDERAGALKLLRRMIEEKRVATKEVNQRMFGGRAPRWYDPGCLKAYPQTSKI